MAFPVSPTVGATYIASGTTYIWDGEKWTTTGDGGARFVVGATGPQGDIGPQGPAGTQGIQGIQGLTGAQGLQGLQGLQGAGSTFGTIVNSDIKIRGRNLGTTLSTSQGKARWSKTGDVCTIIGSVNVNTPFFAEPAASELVVLSFADDTSVPTPTELNAQPFSLLGGSLNLGAERDASFQDKIISYRLKTETTARPDFNFYAETKESNARFELNSNNFLIINDIRTSVVQFNITYICNP